MKTRFSIISFFDPYGDRKSTRKQLSRQNFESNLSLDEVIKIMTNYNNLNPQNNYYGEKQLSTFDGRLKSISDFDKSYFIR